MVAVHPKEIDIFIPWPSGQQTGTAVLTVVAVHLRGHGIDEVMHSLCVPEIFDRPLPEPDVLRRGASLGPPPGPTLSALVIRSEYDRNQLAFAVFQIAGEISQTVKPLDVAPTHLGALLENLIDALGVVP